MLSAGRESVLGLLKIRLLVAHLGLCYSRKNFLEIGGFRPHLPQLGDFEWLLRCLKLGYDIEYIPRTTMRYRMHSGSISSISFRRGQDLV
jgi:GT2 family glycosyltransferase